MNDNLSKILLLILGGTLFLFPFFSSAAGLVPCGGPEEDACTACDLLVLLQNVITFGIKMASLVVIIFIVYGGFRWILSGGNQANIQAGQKAIMGAVTGLIIILCSWIIVNTVFWLIAQAGGDDEYTGNWYKIECNMPSALPSADSGDNGGGGGNGGGNGGGGGGDNPLPQTGDICRSILGAQGYDCHWLDNCDYGGAYRVDVQYDCPDGWMCCYPLDNTTDPPFPTTTTTTTPPTGCKDNADKVRCDFLRCNICAGKVKCRPLAYREMICPEVPCKAEELGRVPCSIPSNDSEECKSKLEVCNICNPYQHYCVRDYFLSLPGCSLTERLSAHRKEIDQSCKPIRSSLSSADTFCCFDSQWYSAERCAHNLQVSNY